MSFSAAVPPSLEGQVCRVCRGPVSLGYTMCRVCAAAPEQAVPDALGVVSYAVAGRQSGYDMRGYKTPGARSSQALASVSALLAYGLEHAGCAADQVGSALDAWCVVPSRSHYRADNPSPLQRLAAGRLPVDRRVVLEPTDLTLNDRRFHPDAFRLAASAVASHVLLVDDTWTSGGTVLSAVHALRQAGVAHVSALVLARWLNPAFASTPSYLQRLDDEGLWRPVGTKCPFSRSWSCERVS